VGVFDSGIGGLTVARLIAQEMPEEDVIYVGDTANLPYGNKSVPELIKLARSIMDFLVKQGVKVIVAACNTSSSVSIDVLRDRYDVPIIGVVKPGVRAAVRSSRNHIIGVLATEATARSGAYSREIVALDGEARVWEVACPELVPMVEAGLTEGPEVIRALATYLQVPLAHQADTIILGCTHYPYLRASIELLTGGWVNLVDPAVETVNELKQTLAAIDGSAVREQGSARFYATGPIDSFNKIGSGFYGQGLGGVEIISLQN